MNGMRTVITVRQFQGSEVGNNRKGIGVFKAGITISKNHKRAIVILDDRKTKLRLARAVQGKKADLIKDATTYLLRLIVHFIITITFDNSKEFA